ncbi:MAG: leucine-rich repeat domain-containing protein [Treponema sp.]|nr:leucine-rich repeat domain-containing protein [Treponema sp.]
MKNNKLFGFTALIAVIVTGFAALFLTGCDNALTSTPTPAEPRSVTYVSKGSDENKYTLVITENTDQSARYIAQAGDSFTFKVELYKDSNYSVALTYSGKITSAKPNGTENEIKITVNGGELTIIIKGTEMTVIRGKIVLDEKGEDGEPITLDLSSGGTLTPEPADPASNWVKWIDPTSTATLTYTVAADGVCTITVGGKAQPNNETDNWGRWKATASYEYAANINASYVYTFEAWTQSGDRTVSVRYYQNNNDDVRLSTDISLTNVRKTYTIYGEAIPKNDANAEIFVNFSCADQLGTFYVKPLEIREITNSERYSSWVNPDSTAEMTRSIANDVVTVKVNHVGTNIWDAAVNYIYNVQAEETYEYKFEAWTDSGNRTVHLEYYGSGDDSTEGPPWLGEDMVITETRKTYTVFYTITSYDPAAPTKNGLSRINFQCANQTGTFYVRVISVTKLSWGNSGDYVYCSSPSSAVIARYDGNGGSVSIPGTLNGKTVAAIGNHAFAGKNLSSVTIPNGVTSIGNFAFADNQLTSVTIGSGVTSIGDAAFEDNRLTSITIPNSVTNIGPAAFKQNPLTNITVTSGNPAYVAKNSFLMSKNEKVLLVYYGSSKAVTIPNSVTTILGFAFSFKELTSVTIPNSVTSIGGYAFEGNNLTTVIIPDNVTFIGRGAFSNNYLLTSVTIGAGVTLGEDWSSDNAFPGDFDVVYGNVGKAAGTYTRTDAYSNWSKN